MEPKCHSLQTLYDIKRTQLEMVHDRGYNIDPERAILDMDLDQFERYITQLASEQNVPIRNALSRIYEPLSEGKRRMLVFYASKGGSAKQIPLDVIRMFTKLIHDHPIEEAILVVDAPLSSKANQSLSEIYNVNWQVFYDQDLTYNPVKRYDTAKHIRLTEQEKVQKLQEMRTDPSRLPIIRQGDPMVRYYGWRHGDIIKTIRHDYGVSLLSPMSINYRVVVEIK